MSSITKQFIFSNPNLEGLIDDIGQTCHGEYMVRHLKYIGAKTWIIEENYVDKDYLIDYQKYYSRSFDEHGRFTTRIHFFSIFFTAKL